MDFLQISNFIAKIFDTPGGAIFYWENQFRNVLKFDLDFIWICPDSMGIDFTMVKYLHLELAGILPSRRK